MTRYLAGMASTADEISAGRLDATVTPRGSSDRFGHAFVRMTQSARSETLQDLIRRFRGAGAPGLTLARSA